MAQERCHARARTTAVTAARRLRTAARNLEKLCARHWPMAAYGVLTVATMAYVVVQLTRI